MITDTSEKGLEDLIVNHLIEQGGYESGRSGDFDRAYALDLKKLSHFLEVTQREVYKALPILEEGPQKTQFLSRLQGEITKRGVVDVLRHGIKHGRYSIDLYYPMASEGNPKAEELHHKNLFSLTRQLRYSQSASGLAIDLALFINGLPIMTFELKNRLTKQTVSDAVGQYCRDRDPREPLFQFGRCAVHFALDEQEVRMCTELKGKGSWFLPFNKGRDGGAGNPLNPNGLATDYLWKEILEKKSLANILENYTQIIEIKDDKGRKKRNQLFPRYHQLDVVRKLLKDAAQSGVGKKYLIQHSAGSGKSNSIAYLAHQLIELTKEGKALFDSVVVVTDRKVLDRQIQSAIKHFAQVSATVGNAERSGDLQRFLQSGKKIIITTVQKFPFILEEMGKDHNTSSFALIIDEAHSSQGGRTAAKMNMALSQTDHDDDESVEDTINKIMESKKMLSNASYFAFTATPKNKTLEIFGKPFKEGDVTKFRPFHSYTMKQAIEEGFILDVLKSYTPVESYYLLAKKLEEDPLYDSKKAQKKLCKYVESNEEAIYAKGEIMVDHFLEHVRGKIEGRARAMVAVGTIDRAIEYYHAIKSLLQERKSPYQAIVAFSGEHDYGEKKVSEADLNQFPSKDITDRLKQDPYRFLIVADKFQTGYDEPLLHTMYVDKKLSGVKAVQTLSRLNRSHPSKYDTFVLDFSNDAEMVKKAFADFYKVTLLSEETDPNKLHDLQGNLDRSEVYSTEHIEAFIKKYLSGEDRDTLDPILDDCKMTYLSTLDEQAQVDFKSQAKAFVRTYGFLSLILPYSNASWEKLATFLNFLLPKLPPPKEEDLSRGILEAIDMDSYRVEVQASLKLTLPDEDAEIDPVPMSASIRKKDPKLDPLSVILKDFNTLFGNIEWKSADKIRKIIAEEIPDKVRLDPQYQNAMKNNDKQNARIEHDRALQRVMVDLLSDQTELYKQFSDNLSFKNWLSNTIFGVTYHENRHR